MDVTWLLCPLRIARSPGGPSIKEEESWVTVMRSRAHQEVLNHRLILLVHCVLVFRGDPVSYYVALPHTRQDSWFCPLAPVTMAPWCLGVRSHLGPLFFSLSHLQAFHYAKMPAKRRRYWGLGTPRCTAPMPSVLAFTGRSFSLD